MKKLILVIVLVLLAATVASADNWPSAPKGTTYEGIFCVVPTGSQTAECVWYVNDPQDSIKALVTVNDKGHIVSTILVPQK